MADSAWPCRMFGVFLCACSSNQPAAGKGHIGPREHGPRDARIERDRHTREAIAAAVALGRTPVDKRYHGSVPFASRRSSGDEPDLNQRVGAEQRSGMRCRRCAEHNLGERSGTRIEGVRDKVGQALEAGCAVDWSLRQCCALQLGSSTLG